MDDVRDGLLFARRIYVPRVVGTMLCGFYIAVTAFEEMPLAVWGLLAINSILWAHIAFSLSVYSNNPFKVEKINFLADSLFCGFWIAIMNLRPLPSVLIFSMVAMNNAAVGGTKFLIKGLGFKVVGFALAFIFVKVNYDFDITSEVLLCLPIICVYPVVLGLSFYSLAAELKSSKSLLRGLSRTDSLTGLLNRRYWCEVVSGFISRPKSIESSFLVMVDVDRFKFINDTYGHEAGDKALCILADMLRSKLRATDIICRFGGDEFCIFLKNISAQDAVERLKEVGKVFESEVDATFPSTCATLSIGVASWNPEILDVENWLALADKNLYVAKRNGRNQIFIETLE